MTRALRLAGVLGGLALAIGGQALVNLDRFGAGALLFAAAALLWFVSAGRDPVPGRRHLTGRHLAWARTWTVIPMALGAAIIGIWAWLRLDVRQTTDIDWLRYLASLGLFVAAILSATPWRRPGRLTWRRGWAAGLLVCVLLIAAEARLTNLDKLPFGTWYDEAANGLEALRMVREPAYRPIYTDGVNATGHYLWLIVGAFKVFGVSTAAIRLVSGLMGTATVAAAYLVGRELRGPVLGLAFALLVAVGHWSLNFSRMGMYNAATPLFELLAFGFLLRGMRTGAPADFAWSGMSLGFGLCFYSAFQLFGPVLLIFVAAVMMREWRNWPRLALGLTIAALGTVLVFAPVAKFALERQDAYFSRIETTSLLADKGTDDRLPALWANTRKHLLMFHVQGDPNGRHNVAGAPLVDPVSGGLMILGFAICARNVRRSEYLVIPLWLAVGMLGGILSLDFEAPQSLRSIAAQPAAYLMAALPVQALYDSWRTHGPREAPYAGGIAGALLLAPVIWSNLNAYFVTQANGFSSWNNYSTPETLTARLLNSVPQGIDPYVIALYDDHPTVRFLADNVEYGRIETNATLPLTRQANDGVLLILDTDRRDLYEEAKRLYPSGSFTEIRPPFGGPVVLYTVLLDHNVLATVKGLTGSYRSESGAYTMRKDTLLDFMWPDDSPVPAPFEVEWSGSLALDTYGPYRFHLEAPGNAELRIGEQVILSGDGRTGPLVGGLLLARGIHQIRVGAEGGEGALRLSWQPPGGPTGILPDWALYVPPVRSNGLLGRYYTNGAWEGEPALAQIDPKLDTYFHVPILSRPYTVEWTGKLAIPVAGRYTFGLQSIDESTLWIDGTEVVASNLRSELARGQLDLERGLHDIRVRYADRTDHTNIHFFWQPPDTAGSQGLRPVPTDVLFPPQAGYPEVDVSRLARFVELSTQTESLTTADWADEAKVTVILDGLASPRGVAVFGDSVYVAEGGTGRVWLFDSRTETGEVLNYLPELEEPADLATTPDGALIVLDAGAGVVWRVGDSHEAAAIAVPKELVNRSRGLDADREGRFWLAATASGRVLAFDPSGTVVADLSYLPAGSSGADAQTPMQPVDVAVDQDGVVAVSDVSGHELVRFDQAGYLLARQTVPVANSMDGPHFAVDRDGRLYVSEPETGRIVRLDSSGAVESVWNARSEEAPDSKPVGLAVDESGRIWTADAQGGRLLLIVPGE